MSRMLETGTPAPFRTVADRKALVGKAIAYLRPCDIDKSGRGYFFPQFGIVAAAPGRELELDNGRSLMRGEIVELNVLVGKNESAPADSASEEGEA